MAVWIVDDRTGAIGKSSRAELESAIEEAGYPYPLNEMSLEELGQLAISRGLDCFCFSKAEALAMAEDIRTRREGAEE